MPSSGQYPPDIRNTRGAGVSALTAAGRAAHGRTVMTDLGQAPQTRERRSRFVIALGVGLLTTVVAAGALAQVGKSSLIGKLEGPEVVTDAAKAPKTFNEAPALAELVKQGKLPAVAERIGQDPLVIKPL